MMTDYELRVKIERELVSLKREFPKRNLVSPRAQQFLEKIRWLEYLLDLPHATIDELAGGPVKQISEHLCVVR